MNPAPSKTDDLLLRVRQQLILAQVRIMELEDMRDELAPKLIETEQLLAAAQSLAEQKAAEAAHLDKIRGDLQVQYEHLRHQQHVTNSALDIARTEAAAHLDRSTQLLSEVEVLQTLVRQLASTDAQHVARIGQLEKDLTALTDESAARLERISQLDAERHSMKSSRSWRWTAWLRAFERSSR